MSHTKGPLETESGGSYAAAIRSNWHGGRKTIAYVEGPGLGPSDENRRIAGLANARLLAAAYNSYDRHCGERAVECAEADLLGELLEACKVLIRAVQRLDCGESHRGTVMRESVGLAESAIAKAEGETC